MRKWFFCAVAVLLLCFAAGACAEVYILDSIYSTIDIPETYPIVLRPDNLDVYATWLETRQTDAETLRDDFQDRGVLLQCWAEDGQTCLEITAVQSVYTIGVFDVTRQNEDMRATYRLSHYPRNEYLGEGYDFSSSSWTKLDGDRFLALKYIRCSPSLGASNSRSAYTSIWVKPAAFKYFVNCAWE